jgi:tetrahydromethanopterin S-methyltransferase subunit G
LSNAISRKALTFEYFRRLKKRGQRDMGIEYALVALLLAFASAQAYFAFGAKGI